MNDKWQIATAVVNPTNYIFVNLLFSLVKYDVSQVKFKSSLPATQPIRHPSRRLRDWGRSTEFVLLFCDKVIICIHISEHSVNA